MYRVSFREGGGGICPSLEFVSQYAHYDNPVCPPRHSLSNSHFDPPSTNFLNESPMYVIAKLHLPITIVLNVSHCKKGDVTLIVE